MITKIKSITTNSLGKDLLVKGWIKSSRNLKDFSFVEINDGSCFSNLQVVVDAKIENYEEIMKKATTGASISVFGDLVKSPGKEQSFELHAKKVEIIGECDPEIYPLQKKHHTFEFLRTIAHIRPRTNTLGAVTRVRSALSFATHKFFQENGFLYIQTPIITASDCEGAGQMFKVSTLDFEKLPKDKIGKIDYEQDFFAKPAFLTVSGQLEGECYACSLGNIYTFGPTFRAENSNTARHLAEFWMIEPEMAFAELVDDMNCAENYLKFCVKYALDNCMEDLQFFDKMISKGLIDRLNHIVEQPFERLPYTKAIEILKNADKKFEFPIEWGSDLQSEHERYLVEEYFKKPVILINYPKEIKSFYMKQNEDGKTVAAMDVLVGGIGEIIGGSQREDNLQLLEKRMDELGLDKQNYWWYLELRKFGSVPHAGFGLGFERLIRLVTGMENIRDVIAFPRYPGHAEF
ncbi:TPA: asparagine--tRNA ligase [Candidatus Dependentiae bacterium]|nr:MAG: Asparagine-tRNA ligase [candidate division TM6 bacterium GW2011_GWE2_31_21]KKP53990.1 MAG: Asparagine-tRNA ligase [candidate division TM6 bacterium GW2011_GWF2_33_332]HBS48429.1 asparagine--tRNA ligase [Candidatus Dependentiae bacterium]HBZ72897.1 asparagine--tRNA ligase [Candidatus Dependentiae bacterium]